MSKLLTYRPSVDGLRAIAVLLVVAYHVFPVAVPGGFTGVDIFFVISGFLISTILYREFATPGLRGWAVIGRFYRRRIRRIFPALAVVLLACYAIGYKVLFPESFQALCLGILESAGFGLNLAASRQAGYFEPDSLLKPLLHLWSLGVEEQFYLAWPLVIWLTRQTRIHLLPVLLFLSACSFFLFYYPLGENRVQAFFLPWTRFWELSLGSLAALAYPSTEKWFEAGGSWAWRRVAAEAAPVAGIVLIAWGVAFIPTGAAIPGPWALLATGGAVLVLLGGDRSWVARQALANPLAVGIGLISYPLYLWHWPLLIFSRLTWPTGDDLVHRLGAAAASFLLAWLTYRWVETPLRRGKSATGPVVLSASAVAVIALVALVTERSGGMPSRFPPLVLELDHFEYRYDNSTPWRAGTYFLRANQSGNDYRVDPKEIDPTKPTLMLWGDSHAAQLYPGLAKRFAGRYNIVQRSAIQTGPFLDYVMDGHPQLKPLNDYAFELARRIRPQQVVLAANWYYYPGWPDAIRRTVRAVQGLGITHIIVVGPVPHWPTALPQQFLIYYRAHLGGGFPDRLPRGDMHESGAIDAQLAPICQELHVTYVSPYHLLQDERGFITRFGNRAEDLEAFDSEHLTVTASDYVVGKFPELPSP